MSHWVADAQVTNVLGGPQTAVESLRHNPLNAVTGGIWRVTAGSASAVVKVVTDGSGSAGPEHWRASEDPRHFNYWRRELEAYEGDLPGGFRPQGIDAPRLLRIADHETHGVLWLDDERGAPASAWDVSTFASFARALGRAQGAMAASDAWHRSWLSHRFLRTYTSSKPVDEATLDDPERWARPRVRRHMGGLQVPLTRLHRERHDFYDLAEACPRTLCHLDVWPANLIQRDDGTFVLFDWSFCGDGALGEDVANLIPDAVFDLLVPASMLDDLAPAVEEAYLAGVGESGWDGDERWIRLGLRAAAVKYHWLVGALLRDADRDDAVAYGGVAVDPDAL